MQVILASQSIARKDLLDILSIEHKVIPSNINEKQIRDKDPKTQAKLIAEAKAKKVAQYNPKAIIIAADTFILYNNKILEKPKTKKEAHEMLNTLSNQIFEVVCGLCVIYNKKLESDSDICQMKFREISSTEIIDYSKKHDLTKFAGAFESEGILRFGEHITGCPSVIPGLPVNKLISILDRLGLNKLYKDPTNFK